MSKKILKVMTLDELMEKTVEELFELDGLGPERSLTLVNELNCQNFYLKLLDLFWMK